MNDETPYKYIAAVMGGVLCFLAGTFVCWFFMVDGCRMEARARERAIQEQAVSLGLAEWTTQSSFWGSSGFRWTIKEARQ